MSKIIEFIKEFIDVINKVYLVPDKMKHFIAGYFIYLLFSLVVSNGYAVLFTIFVAVTKELVFDKYLKRGKAELLDVYMTVIPAILMYFLA